MGKVSLNTTTYTAGGLSEGDVTITEAIFEMSEEGEYGSSAQLKVTFTDDDEKEYQKWYNVGKSKYVIVNDEGELESADDDKEYSLSLKSAAGKFFVAMENCGFPSSLLDDEGLAALVGIKVHVEQVPSGTKGKDGQDKTIVLPTKILDGLKGKKAGKAAAAKPATKTGKPASKKAAVDEDEEGDAMDAAKETLRAILGDVEAPITLKALQGKAFTAVKKHPQKKEIIALLGDADFLGLEDGWVFDADEETVAAE